MNTVVEAKQANCYASKKVSITGKTGMYNSQHYKVTGTIKATLIVKQQI
jgi:hypothetical protein